MLTVWWFALAAGSALVFGLAGLLMKVSQMREGALSPMLLGLYASGTCGFWLQAALSENWAPLDFGYGSQARSSAWDPPGAICCS